MFLREIKTKGKTYLHIIKSYWEDGKAKQKSIAALGCLEDLQQTSQLKKIAKALLKYCSDNPTALDITTAQEKTRKRWGAVAVFKKIWDTFGFPELFSMLLKERKIQFDFFSAVFLMILDRLMEPKSKLKSYEEQSRYHGIRENSLDHLYRALDILASNKEKLEKALFERNVSLFNMSVDVVFFDVTTLYFESQKISDLKLFGFSKDCKVNEVQVVVSLIIDKEGRPIGFDVFPGNTFEGKTLETAVKKLKKDFNIDRLIFVGDRAMFSAGNFEILKENNYEYIISSRIKSKGKAVKEKILDEKWDYEKEEEKGDVFKYKEIVTKGERLIITWSSKRARKDRADRERLIRRAEELLEKNRVANKGGARKYLKVEVEKAGLNQEKIELDARWDGYYGLETNNQELSVEVVIERYHDLWRIEESFRILKSHLETRPIFHWTEKRILGHLVLCFLAFLLERTLEVELKRRNIEYSPERIRRALDELQYSEVAIEGSRFYLRSSINGLANDILRAMRIKIPPQVTSSDSFPVF
ncbi:MAG: IS1634 family transposase [Actinobacteria bacterium]|nr:IS1634 family transposase [Actinomycetota bacterium]